MTIIVNAVEMLHIRALLVYYAEGSDIRTLSFLGWQDDHMGRLHYEQGERFSGENRRTWNKYQ